MKLRKPCDNCPWRIDAPRGHWADDHFESIAVNCRDDGQHVMLCHKAVNMPGGAANPEAPICQGWVRVIGFDAVGVRIAALRGRVTSNEVNDVSPPRLFKSFEAMLRANGIKVPKRNRWTP